MTVNIMKKVAYQYISKFKYVTGLCGSCEPGEYSTHLPRAHSGESTICTGDEPPCFGDPFDAQPATTSHLNKND